MNNVDEYLKDIKSSYDSGNYDEAKELILELSGKTLPDITTDKLLKVVSLFLMELFVEYKDSIEGLEEMALVVATQSLRYENKLDQITGYNNTVINCLDALKGDVYADACLNAANDIKKFINKL